MSSLGRFLEFSIRTPDIIESLSFYKLIGFSDCEIGDVWAHKYAVVSDGLVNIGLHERVFDAPAVTFVHPDLAKHSRSMTDHGFDFSFMQLGEDAFNELGLPDRDGHMVTMLEARTFSGSDEFEDDSILGTWFELSLPARNAVRSARFWAAVAPNLLRVREEPTTHMRFDAGGAALGLSESIALKGPSLCFRCHDTVVQAVMHGAHEQVAEPAQADISVRMDDEILQTGDKERERNGLPGKTEQHQRQCAEQRRPQHVQKMNGIGIHQVDLVGQVMDTVDFPQPRNV